MKHIIACFFGIILIASCKIQETYKIDNYPVYNYPENITLMPFLDKENKFGYVNAETFEIVIPAQYIHAGRFVNGFAVAAKEDKKSNWRGYQHDYLIINKNNEVVLKNIDEVKIIDFEDGKTTFALTENYLGRKFYKGYFTLNIPYIARKPINTNYSLYNLNTGKLIWEEKFRYERAGYEIKFISNYMIFTLWYDNYVYEMQNDGIYIKVNKKVKEITEEINQENVFNNDGDHVNWLISNIDMDLLIQNLPENLRIGRWYNYNKIWENNDDWIYHVMKDDDSNGRLINLSFDDASIGRGFIRPLREKTWLFSVDLITQDKKEYTALYDASENKWMIHPIEKRYEYEHFVTTEFDDWIKHNNDFYNIRTRDKYTYLFDINEGDMTYMGYCENERYVERFAIEKF
jgi:hypothetical protein